MRSLMFLLAMPACVSLDLDDANFAPDAAWYVPSGQLCGLASGGDDHRGVACRGGWDPAASHPDDGEVATVFPKNPTRCPSGYYSWSMPDAESSNYHLTCIPPGNEDESSGSLWDVPAGTACGFARPSTGLSQPCMDWDILTDGCPTGTRLRVLPDMWQNRLNPETLEDDYRQGDPVGGGWSEYVSGGDPVFFCEVVDGCEDCPPGVEIRGALCGLHSTHLLPMVLEDPCDAVRDDADADGDGDTHEIEPFVWIMHPMGMVREMCRRHEQSALPSHEYAKWVEDEAFREALRTPAQCRGEIVVPTCLDPLPEPGQCDFGDAQPATCPAEMELRCTSDFYKETAWKTDAWCWCSSPSDPEISRVLP